MSPEELFQSVTNGMFLRGLNQLWLAIALQILALIVEELARWLLSFASRIFLGILSWIFSFARWIFFCIGKFCSRRGSSSQPSSSRASLPIPEVTVPEPSLSELSLPELPNNLVGLGHQVWELKRRLFEHNFNKVGVSAMGGSGKTTLAAALCRDPQVKEHFGNKIIFQKVSQSPDILNILEGIWMGITGAQPVPSFQSIQDGRRRLKEWLSSKEPQNILVVLDDVWPEDSSLKNLLFEAKGYKTVVTARHTFRWLDDTYDLPLLGEKDALSLFCYEAFGQKSIPDKGYNKTLVKQRERYSDGLTLSCYEAFMQQSIPGRGYNRPLVKEVAAECQGLPLALVVIGRCLYKMSGNAYWEHARDKLSEGGPIDRAHEEGVLKSLAVSIEMLDDEMRQCFSDLALFPGVKKVPVDMLFDIWIYAHNLKPSHARRNLLELERRRLLSVLNDNIGEHLGINEGSTCELYVVQHDVLRSLAIYLVEPKQPENICKRLRLDPLSSWESHSHEIIKAAEIIAIRTGPKKENRWPEVEFPKARALVLIFAGDEVFLPVSVQTMSELKVLIIFNLNSTNTKLGGMSAFGSLTRLKSLRLHKLTLPPLQDYCRFLKNLRKLSLCFCKSDNEALDLGVCSQLTTLEEINVGYCMDIRELPDSICNLAYLEKLTITNCHELDKIPENLGEVGGSLVRLTLGACPALEELPDSICNLRKLEFLDISECQCLETLPSHFGNLSKLQYLDMRECKKIMRIPQSANGLTSLRHVICDENLANQWSSLLPNIEVTISEQKFDLKWLE